MSSITKKNLAFLSFLSVIPIVFIQFLNLDIVVLLVLILFYYVFIISIINNKLGLFLFILIRPSLDYFTHFNVLKIDNFNLNVASIYAIILLIFASFVILKRVKQIKIKEFLLMYLFFLIVLISGIFFSVDTAVSIAEIVRIFSIIIIFLLSYLLIDEKQSFINLIQVIIYSTIIPAIVAFNQYFTKTGLSIPSENIYNRLHGTFSHPNIFAAYLVLSISLVFIMVAISDVKDVKTLNYGIYGFILFVLLLLTLARGALIGLFIVILITSIIKYKKVIFAFIMILVLSYFISTPIQQRFDKIIHPDPYGSIAYRINLYRDIVKYIKEKPIMGYGVGTAVDVISKNRGDNPHPHNDYLKVGLELGLVGLFVYILLIFHVLLFLIKNYFKNNDNIIETINLFLIAISIAIFIIAGGDNILRNTSLQWSYWALIGGFLALKIKKVPRLIN